MGHFFLKIQVYFEAYFMAIIDISCPIQHHPAEREDFEVSKTLLPLKSDRTSYTGVIYRLSQGSMNSSYIDLPGHIAETDDGRDGANTPPQDFFRLPCTVVRLDLSSGYGAVQRISRQPFHQLHGSA